MCTLLLPVLHIFSLPLKKRAKILLSGFPATELSTNGQRVSVQRLWYQNSIWLVFEKAKMKCTLDNFMMTCRILGCFYLFIVVIVTYTTAVILPSNMTTVQVICWIFNQLRKTLPIVKIVYLIVYDIQAWNKFVDRYIFVANGIKNEQAGNNTLQNMWAHKNCLKFSI